MRTSKPITTLLLLLATSLSSATAPWLDNLNHPLKQQQIDSRWQADGGQIHLRFNHNLLNAWQVSVTTDNQTTTTIDGLKHQSHTVRNTTALSMQAPFGILQAIPDGMLHVDSHMQWTFDGRVLEHRNWQIVATKKHLTAGEIASLLIQSESGFPMFYLDHIHTELDIKNHRFHARRMDIRVTQELAKALNRPLLSGIAIGEAHMENHLTIPAEYELVKGQSTCPPGRPLWPDAQNPADVALINMTWQMVRNLNDGRFVFAPNATLKNVGVADVVWQPKFSGDHPPYNNAQHPYLFWAAYREIDGRFEQIGTSQIKHAFFTVNTNCTIDCGSNQILYPGCEDIYSVGNNDSGGNLGPKIELEAFTGIWEEVGSFFDPNSDGQQDNSSNNSDENRLIIHESDINNDSNDYYFSAWYIVRDDVNIFNTMGHRQYDLLPNQQQTSWSFINPGPFTQGPASDAYLTPNTTAPDLMSASHRTSQAGEGHLTAAVKIIDLGGGEYRYNYMVENHDYDPQVEAIEIPLDDDAAFSAFIWSDLDDDANNDWQVTRQDNRLILTQVNDNHIDWGALFSFSFTTDRPPEAGQVTLTGHENSQSQFTIQSLRPQLDDLIFEDGFE